MEAFRTSVLGALRTWVVAALHTSVVSALHIPVMAAFRTSVVGALHIQVIAVLRTSVVGALRMPPFVPGMEAEVVVDKTHLNTESAVVVVVVVVTGFEIQIDAEVEDSASPVGENFYF